MLAASGPFRGTAARWVAQPKLDGFRALVYCCDGELTVRTRTGRDITASLPELAGLPAALGGRNVVLDAELVLGGDPRSFYSIAGAVSARFPEARAAEKPLSLACFDVLYDGADIRALPYRARREVLLDLELAGPAWCTVPSYSATDLPELFAVVTEMGLEGLVLKELDSHYLEGRSKWWVKVKTAEWKHDHSARRHDHSHMRVRRPHG